MKMISVSREWVFRRVGPLLQSLPRRPPAPFYQTRTHGGDGDGDSTGDGGDGDSTGTHVMVVMEFYFFKHTHGPSLGTVNV